MELFKIFGTLGLKGVDETNSELQDVTGTAKNASSGMGAAFKKIGGALAAAFAVDKIIDFGKEIVNVAAEVSAEQSAFEQIMGDFSNSAKEKLNSVADATGVMSTRMQGHFTSLSAKFKGLGFDTEKATALASRGLTLAADAAAFWDVSLDNSSSHLNSFINGSYEGGEAIGLFANDTQMAMYAVEKGIVSSTKEWANLDEATKQATRLEYAENMYALSGATGQAAREADQFANVQANLAEKWRQFKAQIGEPLLEKVVTPAMAALSKVIDVASEAFNVLTGKVDVSKSSFVKFEEPINKIKNAFEKLKQIFEPVFETIKNTIQENIPKWKESFENLGESFEGLQPIFEVVAGALVLNLGVISSLINGLIGAINGIIEVIDGMVEYVGGILEVFIGLVTGDADKVNEGWKKIKEGAEKVFGGLWDSISGYLEGFADGIVSFFDGLGIDLEGIWDDIVETASSVWETISNAIEVAIQFIGEIINAAVEIISIPFNFIWENCKDVVISTWETIKSFVENAVNAVKTTIENVFNKIEPIVSAAFNTVKNTVSVTWNGIKSAITNTVNEIKVTVSNVFDAIKTAISKPLNDAKNTVSNIFDSIKAAITDKIEGAKTAVTNAINAIKKAFNFSWSLPKLKLPHISISGSFSLNPPSVPHFGIEWYKKAMNSPMWLDSPTIFGMNPSGKLLAGGESGDEIVAGAAKLQTMIREGVQIETHTLSDRLNTLIDMMAEYMPEVIKNMKRELVLDSGALVGQLAPAVDGRLGDINELRKRGN